jgi:hypothetical protein
VSFPNATKEVKPIFHHTWGAKLGSHASQHDFQLPNPVRPRICEQRSPEGKSLMLT